MQRALLLDRNYMALSVVPWKKAVKLMVKGKAEPVDSMSGSTESHYVKHGDSSFRVPSIIRLLVVIPWKAHMGRMRFSRRNMMVRDRFECQYCGKRVGKAATIDHVIPRSRGGKTDYNNCVTSCRGCNNKKADKTPQEAKIALRSQPRRPTFLAMYRHYLSNSPEEWGEYIIGLKAYEN